jgi:hypothetical protein
MSGLEAVAAAFALFCRSSRAQEKLWSITEIKVTPGLLVSCEEGPEMKVTPGLLVSCEEGAAKKLSAYTKTAGVLSPAVPVTKGKS